MHHIVDFVCIFGKNSIEFHFLEENCFLKSSFQGRET